MSKETKSTVLDGIRIVENTVWLAGNIAGALLGDLGAEIIKVEKPGGGPEAGSAKLHGAEIKKVVNGHEIRSNPINHNKKRVTIDVTKEKGLEAMYRLIEKSDGFIQNLSPGKVKELGIDYPTLCRYNPGIVYGTINGYGPHGPDSAVPSQDPTGLARSGLMFAAHPGKDPTYLVGILGDTMTGTTLAYGMLAALLHRKRTGEGQEVSVSQLGSLVWLHFMHVAVNLFTGDEFHEHVRSNADDPLTNWYKCQDGKWICFSTHQSDLAWPGHCEILGIKELEKDPRFENSRLREQNATELIGILDKVLATKPREEWLELYRKVKTGIAFAPLNTIPDLSIDPQTLANGDIQPFDHPIAGLMNIQGRPIKFSKSPGPEIKRTPELGEFTEDILNNVCGYTWEEIETMSTLGAI